MSISSQSPLALRKAVAQTHGTSTEPSSYRLLRKGVNSGVWRVPSDGMRSALNLLVRRASAVASFHVLDKPSVDHQNLYASPQNCAGRAVGEGASLSRSKNSLPGEQQ
jgi:hypothetical protein